MPAAEAVALVVQRAGSRSLYLDEVEEREAIESEA
jgi:hypothetical protein